MNDLPKICVLTGKQFEAFGQKKQNTLVASTNPHRETRGFYTEHSILTLFEQFITTFFLDLRSR